MIFVSHLAKELAKYEAFGSVPTELNQKVTEFLKECGPSVWFTSAYDLWSSARIEYYLELAVRREQDGRILR